MAIDADVENRIKDLEQAIQLLTSNIELLTYEVTLLKNEGCWIHKQRSVETGELK